MTDYAAERRRMKALVRRVDQALDDHDKSPRPNTDPRQLGDLRSFASSLETLLVFMEPLR